MRCSTVCATPVMEAPWAKEAASRPAAPGLESALAAESARDQRRRPGPATVPIGWEEDDDDDDDFIDDDEDLGLDDDEDDDLFDDDEGVEETEEEELDEE